MSGLMLLQVCCFCTLFIWCVGASNIEHGAFNYGANGPDKWATYYKQFCAGRKQSPVNLSPMESEYDSKLTEYTMRVQETPQYTLDLRNDGHKLVITTGSSLVIQKGLGDKMFYTAQQLHWHWGADSSKGSEHTIAGKPYPMEGHLVFWNSVDYPDFKTAVHSVGGLAVLGVFYELSANENPLLLAIEDYLPQLTNANSQVNVTFNASDLNFLDAFLPKSTRQFYRYEGSLTTPSCNENVLWTVCANTVPVSERQLNLLRSLRYPNGKPCVDNFRPVQPLNRADRPGANRVVYRTFGGTTRYQTVGGGGGCPAGATAAQPALVAAAIGLLGSSLLLR